jgi:hypothetical protein
MVLFHVHDISTLENNLVMIGYLKIVICHHDPPPLMFTTATLSTLTRTRVDIHMVKMAPNDVEHIKS